MDERTKLERGVDFNTKLETFRATVINQVKRYTKKKVRTAVRGNFVIFQVYDEDNSSET